MMQSFTSILLVLFASFQLSACGGGSSVKSTSPQDMVAPVNSMATTAGKAYATEYDSQYGLAMIQAASLNDAG
jgi:hypothetical protein